MATYTDSTRQGVQRIRQRRPGETLNRRREGIQRTSDGVEEARLGGGVGLVPIGDGPGLAGGERSSRGARDGEIVEDGGDVFEAFADGLPRADVLVSDGLG